MGKLRFGVIGVGVMGRIHAEHLASRVPGAELSAIADINLGAAQAIGERWGVKRLYRDYTDLLADPDVDAVAVCTPRPSHAPVTIAAASAGKHVFCEKPLACGLNEADQALAAVANAGVKLQVGFNRRFDPNFRYVRETIAAGGIGAPRILHIVSRDPAVSGYTPSLEDIFLETTIHDFDVARYLTGAEAESVYAVGLQGSEAGLGGALVVLQLAGGAVATIDNHVQSPYGYDQRVEVLGSDGALSTDNQTPYRATLSDRTGLHGPLPLPFFPERYAESYVAEMSDFVRCIVEDSAPAVTGADGRAAVALALAALDSLRQGRPVSPVTP